MAVARPAPRLRAGRRRGATRRHPDAAAGRARAAHRAARRQAADPRGPGEPRAARRHLVLPPGRRVRRRAGALVRPRRPRRLERGHGPAQLERHGHHREPPSIGWYRKEFTLPRSPKKAKPLLEGPLRGQQLPHEGLAERRGARVRSPATSRSRCCCRTCARAATRSSWRSRRCAATPTSPTGGRPRSTASAPAAGGTSAGSCARSTCGASTRSTWSTCTALPRLRRVRRPGEGRGAHDAAELHEEGPRRVAHDHDLPASASRSSPRPCPRSAGASSATTFTSSGRACGRRATPSSTTCRVERGHRPASCAAPTGSRSACARSRRGPGGIITAQRQAAEPARREHPRGRPRRRAARSRRPRGRLLLNRLKNLGATITRSHYPLHPAFIEALDRAGIMYWVEAPVYQVPDAELGPLRASASSPLRAATLTVEQQPQPPVDPHVVAGERAGRRRAPNLGTYSAEPRALRPRSVARRCASSTTRGSSPRPPVARRRAATPRTRTSTSTCSA